MKHFATLALAAFVSAAVLSPFDNVYAQNRRTSSGSGSSVQKVERKSRNTSATRSSGNVRRPTSSSQNRQATTSSQNHRTSGTQTRRQATTSSQDRRTTTSQNRQATTTSQDRRTTGTQTRRQATTQDRKATTSSSSRRNNTAATRNGNVTSSNSSVRRTSGKNRTQATGQPQEGVQAGDQQIHNVTVNSNVTRRGLTSAGSAESRPGGGRMDDRGRGDMYMQGHDVVRIPPRERDFIPYERVDRFWDRGPHYFGYRISVLPPGYARVSYFGIDYYRFGNVYYRPFGGVYVVCRPPFGTIIEDIVTDVVFSAVNFAFYSDMYRTYSGFDSYSRYIDAQNRQIAENNAILASQNRALALNSNAALSSYEIADALGLAQSYAYADQEYYYSDGVFYIINGGHYQTIVPPAGALVDELPDDYDIITLNGTEYYRVDDTVYRVTLIEGHPYLEVLGQMYGKMARRYSQY